MSTPDHHVTPRVLAYLRDALADVPVKYRCSFERVQLVLRQAAKWSRATDEAGVWRSNDSIEQLAAGTCLKPWVVSLSLQNLERVGLVVTERHGGGRGQMNRGSTRLLVLDPVAANVKLRGVEPAQFAPKLRGVEAANSAGLGPKLRGVEPETPRGQPRDSVSTVIYTSVSDTTVDNDAERKIADTEEFELPPDIYARIGHHLPQARPRAPQSHPAGTQRDAATSRRRRGPRDPLGQLLAQGVNPFTPQAAEQ